MLNIFKSRYTVYRKSQRKYPTIILNSIYAAGENAVRSPKLRNMERGQYDGWPPESLSYFEK